MMGVGRIVLDRRLTRMQRKSTGLAGLCCVRGARTLSGMQVIFKPEDWLMCIPQHPVLGKAERPVAQGPGHVQPGQRRLAGFWPHLVAEELLLVPPSLSTGCHC